MSVTAKLSNCRMSAQKVRLIVDLVRGKKVAAALAQLKFSRKKASGIVSKLINSAVSNAENNDGLDPDDLFIKGIYVGEASTFKRMKPRAKGRGCPILKRTCHIFVELDEVTDQQRGTRG